MSKQKLIKLVTTTKPNIHAVNNTLPYWLASLHTGESNDNPLCSVIVPGNGEPFITHDHFASYEDEPMSMDTFPVPVLTLFYQIIEATKQLKPGRYHCVVRYYSRSPQVHIDISELIAQQAPPVMNNSEQVNRFEIMDF